MRAVNFFSLAVILIAALFTWQAIAVPVDSVKVHLLDNLSPSEEQLAKTLISKRGYRVSDKDIFSESERTVVITKTIGEENELPSIQIEIMEMEKSKSMPHQTFTTTIPSSQLNEAIELLPKPGESGLKPVALQH